MRALEAALNEPWAMEEGALATLLTIAAREHEITPEALEAYRAKTIEGSDRAQIRDGVAIINATGPLMRRANLFSAISGATSYDIMRRDLQAAVDAGASAVLLNIDSPGGAVNGGNELAQAIYDLRGKVPVVAYVGGTAASMGYWLASAADAVVIDPTAILGSIGVQAAMTVDADPKGAKSYTFISSQSPNKNAGPDTPEGAKAIQGTVDSLAQVFVETVARNRGVDVETVLSGFGKGGTFVGQDAVAAGLADRIGTFESVLAELSAGTKRPKGHGIMGAHMADENFTAEQRDSAVAAALAAEKARVAGLRRIAAAHGATDADLTAAIDGTTTVESFALSMADKVAAKAVTDKAAADAAAAAALTALRSDEDVAAAAAAAASVETPNSEISAGDKLAAQIVADAKLARGE